MKYRRKVPKARKDPEGKALPVRVHKMKPLKKPKHKKEEYELQDYQDVE